MKSIPLTQGKFALVDDEDYEYLMQWKWHFDGKYAMCNEYISEKKRHTIYMHAVIMKTPKGMETDHIDRNKLNNTRANLRVCTSSQNKMNQGQHSNNTSGHPGVSWDNPRSKWKAYIQVKGKCLQLGRFDNIQDAISARKQAVKKYYGEFGYE